MKWALYIRSFCKSLTIPGGRPTFRYTLNWSLDRLCFRRKSDQEIGPGTGICSLARARIARGKHLAPMRTKAHMDPFWLNMIVWMDPANIGAFAPRARYVRTEKWKLPGNQWRLEKQVENWASCLERPLQLYFQGIFETRIGNLGDRGLRTRRWRWVFRESGDSCIWQYWMVSLLAHANALSSDYSYELVHLTRRKARYVKSAVFQRLLWSNLRSRYSKTGYHRSGCS
jgi:hypothetical protein